MGIGMRHGHRDASRLLPSFRAHALSNVLSLVILLWHPTLRLHACMRAALLRWSPDSQYLASVNLAVPGTVWVWDMAAGDLGAVLVHTADVADVQWAPKVRGGGGGTDGPLSGKGRGPL